MQDLLKCNFDFRIIDIYQGVIEKTCSILNQLLSNDNNSADSSTFGLQFQQLTSAWTSFLRELRSFAKIDQRFNSLIETESFGQMFEVSSK